MSFDMSPTTEERIRAEAERYRLDVDSYLNGLLDTASRERDEEIAGVRRGLADVAAGRTRRFADFLEEHKRRHPSVLEEAVSE